jgi:choline kinase
LRERKGGQVSVVKAIIIGAGRGQRLMPHTRDAPKCFAEVGGRRILDWGIEALHAAGLDDIVFIGGYRIEQVRKDYPEFTYCHNADWKSNNIMVSLMHAEFHMDEGFVCAYSDILYRPEITMSLMRSPNDITLVCDTEWHERYRLRTDHPESDAEKMAAVGNRLVAINRTMPSEAAQGEYIGVARFTQTGAMALRDTYHRARAEVEVDGKSFQAAPTFQKAYLIDLIQEMIDGRTPVHILETEGGYMEVDTNQDFQIAREQWS